MDANPAESAFGCDLHARHYHDHTRLAHEVPADQRGFFGRRAVRDREAALALVVAERCERERAPLMWGGVAKDPLRLAGKTHGPARWPTASSPGVRRLAA